MVEAAGESWAERALRALSAAKLHSGAARRTMIELLDAQSCARTAVEIEDELRARGRPVARASIYRILDELGNLSLVQRIDVGQPMARYEPVRAGAGHHHHLVCDSCGSVTPFHDSELEAAIAHLSRRVPLRVAEHEIVLHGACDRCDG